MRRYGRRTESTERAAVEEERWGLGLTDVVPRRFRGQTNKQTTHRFSAALPHSWVNPACFLHPVTLISTYVKESSHFLGEASPLTPFLSLFQPCHPPLSLWLTASFGHLMVKAALKVNNKQKNGNRFIKKHWILALNKRKNKQEVKLLFLPVLSLHNQTCRAKTTSQHEDFCLYNGRGVHMNTEWTDSSWGLGYHVSELSIKWCGSQRCHVTL